MCGSLSKKKAIFGVALIVGAVVMIVGHYLNL